MRTVAYCGNNTALTTTKYGRKIYVDTRDTSLAPHLMLDGDWEPWVTGFFMSVMGKERPSLFIDVGANFGWYTLLAAGAGSRTIAFEPNSRLADLLSKTIAVNGYRDRVTVCEAALASEPGTAFLSFDWHELGGGALWGAPEGPRGVSRQVVKTSLDHERASNLLLSTADSIAMKIDVEGYEVEVLHGAARVLEKTGLLFVKHHQAHAESLFELMTPTYDIMHIEHTGHPGAPLNLARLREVGEAETLFLRRRG